MSALETVGDFTVPAPPAEKTCQNPGTCKNRAGCLIGASDPTFRIVNRTTGQPVLLCLHCKQHMDQKPTTVVRVCHTDSTPASSGSVGFFELWMNFLLKTLVIGLFHPVDAAEIRAASSASQRGGEQPRSRS